MTGGATRRTILALAALLTLAPGAARAAGEAGTVVTVKGNCVVVGSGGSRTLKIGDAVAVADTVEVPADGRLRLRMTDGSVIALASGTKMTVADYRTNGSGQRQDVKLSLTSGLLRAIVAPTDHPAVFEVSTAVGTAAVRSTDWFIEAQNGAAQVGVLSGSVSLTSAATGHAVTIPARWGARLEAGRDPVQARVWSPAEFQAVIARTDIQ